MIPTPNGSHNNEVNVTYKLIQISIFPIHPCAGCEDGDNRTDSMCFISIREMPSEWHLPNSIRIDVMGLDLHLHLCLVGLIAQNVHAYISVHSHPYAKQPAF